MYIHGLIDTGLLGHGLLGNGLVGPGLVSSSGEDRPPCFDKVVQWLKAPAVDGVLIDKIGSSGSEVNRPEVGGWYFDGDGTRYVDLNQTINLGTEHSIEFKLRKNTGGYVETIVGYSVSNTSHVLITNNEQLQYRVGAEIRSSGNNFILTDGEWHTYKIIRNGTSLIFERDGGQVYSGTITGDLMIDQIAERSVSSPLQSDLSIVQLTDSTGEVTKFTFESGNQDTRVLSTNPDVYGTIQNATGADRVQITALESDMDTNGVIVAQALGNQLFDVNNYVDGEFYGPDGVIQSNSGFYRSPYRYIKGEEFITTTTTPDGGASNVFVDEDFNFITGFNTTQSMPVPSSATYVGVCFRKTTEPDPNVAGAYRGAVVLPYEPWEGYYYDNAQAETVPDGKKSMVRNGKATSFYDASGELATASFVGELKANVEAFGVFDGDGSAYVDFGETINLGTEHTIEFEAVLNNATEIVVGSSEQPFYYVATISGNNLRYKCDVTENAQFPITIDGLFHKYKFVRSGATVSLYIDNTFDSDITLVNNNELFIDVLFNRTTGTPLEFNNRCSYIQLTDSTGTVNKFTFETPSTVNSTQGTTATIQNDDGNRIFDALRNLTTKKSVTDADKLTTVQMFNHDDEDNVYPLVVPVDDFLNQDNPRFTKTDSGEIVEQLLYEEELVDPCLSNVQDYLGF